MKKKILVMYARYGSGHKTIAEYVAKYIEEHNKNVEVMLLDMTDYANGVGKFSVKIMDFVSDVVARQRSCRHRHRFFRMDPYHRMCHHVPKFHGSSLLRPLWTLLLISILFALISS